MVPACQATLHHCMTCPHVPYARFRGGVRSFRRSSSAVHTRCRRATSVQARQSPGGSSDDMSSAFAREMASRTEAQEKALEQGEASTFGGRQLLEALQDRSGRTPPAGRSAKLHVYMHLQLQVWAKLRCELGAEKIPGQGYYCIQHNVEV